MTDIVESLKSASELVRKASEVLKHAAEETYLPSEAARQSVRAELPQIRLHVMLLRRSITIVHAAANRRKPSHPKERRETGVK